MAKDILWRHLVADFDYSWKKVESDVTSSPLPVYLLFFSLHGSTHHCSGNVTVNELFEIAVESIFALRGKNLFYSSKKNQTFRRYV